MAALAPLDWAGVAVSADDPSLAWGKLFEELGNHGFENCSATVMKVGEYVLTDQSYGTVITADFEQHVRDNPEMTRVLDLLVQFGSSDRVASCTKGHPEFDQIWSTQDLRFYRRMQDFGFCGGFGASVLDPWRDEFTIMTASNFSSDAEAIEAYDRISKDFLPAVVFMQEGLRLRELVTSGEFQPLSARERECMSWLCSGLMTSAIAQRMSLSEFTVQEYIRNACTKLKARTRAQGAARATLLQMIKP